MTPQLPRPLGRARARTTATMAAGALAAGGIGIGLAHSLDGATHTSSPDVLPATQQSVNEEAPAAPTDDFGSIPPVQQAPSQQTQGNGLDATTRAS